MKPYCMHIFNLIILKNFVILMQIHEAIPFEINLTHLFSICKRIIFARIEINLLFDIVKRKFQARKKQVTLVIDGFYLRFRNQASDDLF